MLGCLWRICQGRRITIPDHEEMSMEYTEEQKAIAKHYEALAVAHLDAPEFDDIMAEFDAIKAQWGDSATTKE